MKDEKIRIIIADDHPIYRKGLRFVIETAKEIEVIGEADDGLSALHLVESEKPEILIADIDMPKMDGIELAREILQRSLPVKVVFLSMHKDMQILSSLRSLNVKGYCLKESAVTEIVEAILTVKGGASFLSKELTELLIVDYNSKGETLNPSANLSKLTPTEKSILKQIAQGSTNKEISESTFVSIRTVENHRFNICRKLGIKGNHSLLKFAIKEKDSIASQFE